MYAFEYVRPSSLQDAVQRLEASEDAKIVAGGMTLIPTMKQRLAQVDELIDLGAITDLRGVRKEGDTLIVGATTPHNEVARSQDVRSTIPALAHLAEHIGDPQVRNKGTLGGSIANNDPAADYPAAVVGLDAAVHTDRRTIKGDDFFTDMFETALEEGEIITEVRFPKPERAGYAKFPNPASRYAIVGVMVAKTAGGVRVAVAGAGPCVFRADELEQALSSNFAPEAVDGVTIQDRGYNDDLHASAEYRKHLVKVMAKRAVQAALG